MPAKPKYDVAVLGGGIAGLTAALHAGRRGARVVLVEGGLFGGLVANVGAIDGFPAVQPPSGMELAMALLEQVRALGGTVVEAEATAILPEPDRHTVVAGDARPAARAVVVATGARLRSLGVPGEARLRGRGVSQCAFCDAGLFRGQHVAVVGGGDAALQEALHLARHAAQVTLVHRGPRPRARRVYLQEAARQDRLSFRWNTTVAEVLGDAGVDGVRLVGADGAEEMLPVAGVFPFIGLVANSEAVPAAVGRDADGFLATVDGVATSVPGLFAAGAVTQAHGGALTDAVGAASRAVAAALAG